MRQPALLRGGGDAGQRRAQGTIRAMADRKLPAAAGPEFAPEKLDARITVHEASQIVEIDSTGHDCRCGNP
jgi:hypothetical protein